MYPSMLRSISPGLTQGGDWVYAGVTANGSPSLTARRPHPSGSEGAHLCVDIRCRDKRDARAEWDFRVGVEVDAGHDLPASRKRAYRLASQLIPVLSVADLHDSLRAVGVKGDAVASIKAKQPLKHRRNLDVRTKEWFAAVDAAGQAPKVPRPPVFHHDWGRRLVGIFRLNVETVTAEDLAELTRATLDVLQNFCGTNDVAVPESIADTS